MFNKISYLFEKQAFNKFIYIVLFSLFIPILEFISITLILATSYKKNILNYSDEVYTLENKKIKLI